MARKPFSLVLELIRSAIGGKTSGDATDADLLGRFVATREEAAFTAILERHGPLVLGICRRVLGNATDAEDAFQATFLVLVRKAGSIRKGGSISCWLHGVAYRVALEARSRAGRRREQEKHATVAAPTDPYGDVATRELRAILDEELGHLPAKYRAPLILHYLASKTKEETALDLGWSEGTVSGRLARARDLLRGRLTRRGVTVSSGALSAALAQEAAAVTVAHSLASSTASLVTLFAAGEVAAGASTAQILALTESVVHTMFVTKLKIATAVSLLIAVIGLGGGGLILWAQAKQPPVVQEQPAPDRGALAKEPAQAKKPGAIFKAPGSFTLDVALTADGKLLARAGADATVDLWDVASGKKLHTLKGHTAPLFKLAFSPDDKTLASITGTWLPDDVRGEVKLWDVATGMERVALKGHPGRGVALAFSPDGKTLASCGKGTVKLWDVETGKEKMELAAEALSLAFSPNGQTLATATYSVILWDVTNGKTRATLPKLQTFGISCVRFAPDGKTVATVSGAFGPDKDKAGALTLWDVATAKERATIPSRMMTPLQDLDLAFTADGKTMISAIWSFGETQKEGGLVVQHWELATGKAGAAFWAPYDFSGPGGAGTNAGVIFAALSADGKIVAWGGAEGKDEKVIGTAHVWEVGSLATTAPNLSKPEQQGSAEDDLKKLQGTWRLVSYEEKGAKATGFANMTYTFTGDKVHYLHETPNGVNFEATLVLDSTKSPKTIDLKIVKSNGSNEKDKEEVGKTLPGIYAFDEDHLKLCIGVTTRPATFDTKGKRDVVLVILQRQKVSPPGPLADDTEDKAIEAITKLGGRIVRDEKAVGKPVMEVNFTHAYATDAALKELAAFKKLETLNLCYPPPVAGGLIPVTDAGLKELAKLSSLKSLNLRRTKVTDKGLKELKDLTNLQSLNLRETPVTDAGLSELKGLQNLQALDLGSNPRINGAGLKDFKSLRTLDLDSDTDYSMSDLVYALGGGGSLGSGVTDAGLKGLAGLKDLQVLNLGGARVTDAGLKELKVLRSLQSLDLRQTQITDAGLKELKELTDLKLLILVRTKVTNAGMKELKELKSLETVNLWGTQVTDAGLTELKELQGLLAVAPGGNAVALWADGAATHAARKTLKEILSIEVLHLKGYLDNVGDAWLKQVKAFKNLRTLNLDRVAVTEVGFAELKGLQSLQSLSLHRATKVTDAAMKHLKELKNLQSLDLSFSGWQNDTSVNPGSLRHPLGRTDPGALNVTDAGLKDLKELKNLQTLNLEGTQVTDACIADLKEFTSLRTLHLGLYHKITPAGEKELRAALPQLQVTISYPRVKSK